jgi:soluble lytic murein transglycosylase-like protein
MRLSRDLCGIVIVVFAMYSSGLAQDSNAGWAELRRRLAQNMEMDSFLSKYSNNNSRSVKPHKPGGVLGIDKKISNTPISNPNHQEVVRQAACSEGVPPDIALAIIHHESNFDNGVRGKAGELGASQILPQTSELFKFDRERLRKDYEYNVRSGMKIMKFLLDQFSTENTIRAYNGGPAFQKLRGEARRNVETYFSSVQRLRRKYESERCL